MFTTEELLAGLHLEPTGPGCFRADNVPSGHGVVFGGQLMAQAIVAAQQGHDDKRVETLHTVFARAARPDAGVEIEVESMHAGRTVASSTVTIRQGDRLCARSIVVLTADEPDVIRHGVKPPRP